MAQSYASSLMMQRLMSGRTGSTSSKYGSSRTGSAYGTNRTGSTYGTSRYGSAYGVNSAYSAGRYGSAYGTGRITSTTAAAKLDQMYEDTRTAAQNVRTHANVLMSGKERSGREVKTDARNFVDDYNAMIDQMQSMGTSSSLIYRNQLSSSFASHKEELAAVGITAGKDGRLSLNEKTLAGADASAVSKAFGGANSFVGEASVKSIYVEADALSSQTNARYRTYGIGSYGGFGSYGSYGGYSPYSSYSPYGSLNSYSMVGRIFNSLF